MNLLKQLTQFYKNEFNGLPHDKAGLWAIAQELASILEQYGIDDWKISDDWPTSWEADFIRNMRQNPDIALIDTAINLLHQGLLDAQKERSNRLFLECNKDIALYLFNREARK